MMKKLLLFVALLGLALPLRAQDDKALAAAAAKADLKLMSFNIRYYKPGADGDNGWVARRAAQPSRCRRRRRACNSGC